LNYTVTRNDNNICLQKSAPVTEMPDQSLGLLIFFIPKDYTVIMCLIAVNKKPVLSISHPYLGYRSHPIIG
jgi:hypothetical protein